MRPPQKQQAYASAPGKLKKIDTQLWFRCFGQQTVLPISLIVLLVLIGVGMVAVGGRPATSGLVVVLLPIYFLIRTIQNRQIRMLRHFRGGCICAAQVVSVHPFLIAVSSDLSKGGGSQWPVIKILPQPLERVPGSQFQVGDRLVTVAMYRKSPPQLPHWKDFEPIAAVCVTADPQELSRMRAVLDADPKEWEQLAQNLARVSTPRTPGLYFIHD